MDMPVLIRGGGDLASGVALRLFHAGFRPIVTELPAPLVVRRAVSFAEAVFEGRFQVEDVPAQRVDSLEQALQVIHQDCIPVLPDPTDAVIYDLAVQRPQAPPVVIDGRMRKRPPAPLLLDNVFLIGLGPGFSAPENCQAVIETNRGHRLGRVIWNGESEPDTGIPERVAGRGADRVLRAPAAGTLSVQAEIGQHVEEGQVLAAVDGLPVPAPFCGVLRGMMRSGLQVPAGLKIGDVDPRDDPEYCFMVSDKALAIGGAVLEAVLHWQFQKM